MAVSALLRQIHLPCFFITGPRFPTGCPLSLFGSDLFSQERSVLVVLALDWACDFERCGMLQALMNLLSLCWKPSGHDGERLDSVGVFGANSGRRDDKDGLLWFRDFGNYASGEFSMAVVQANQVLEDQSQIESGPFGTFVGVYDGHAGPEAAQFVCDNLFGHFQAISTELNGAVTPESIENAFRRTEDGFTTFVSELFSTQPQLATVGSCCLVGIICQQTLFVANVGDSRAVLGKKVGKTNEITAIQLSTEHNANQEDVRRELKELHPNDPQIVVLKRGVWRVKGIIQVSRSIGDLYLKHSHFNNERINGKFRLPEPISMPILSSVPEIITHSIHPNDSFLIFASDGLWEHLSNEQAVDIVHSHPRSGSAKGLVKAALQEAARKREMRYSDLRKIDKKVRRHFHDDISVIVLFLNHDRISRGMGLDRPLSIRNALDQ